ncbi:MAG: zinc ribbon domain-containing protein [bacterium]
METKPNTTMNDPNKLKGIQNLINSIIRLQNLDLEIEIFNKELALYPAEADKKDLEEVRQSHLKEREMIRTQQIKDIPLLSRIERLQKRYSGHAIVPVIENACHGCRVTVSTRLNVALQKCEQLVYCENCGRILYLMDPKKILIKEPPKPKSKRGRKPKYKHQSIV